MCVILVVPKDSRPSLDTLRHCWDANPHGAGIAWREGDMVHWLKTDSVEDIHRLAQAKRGELIIHFRIASVGGVRPELRHPFPVSKRAGLAESGSARAVLFQNGTWGDYQTALELARQDGHQIPSGPMSDARAAAFLVSIHGQEYLRQCGQSRWLYFGGETAMYGQWHKVDGIYYSNTYWKPRRKSGRSLSREADLAIEAEAWQEARAAADRLLDDPEDTGEIPGATPKRHQPQELWNVSATSYWESFYKKLPQPKKH